MKKIFLNGIKEEEIKKSFPLKILFKNFDISIVKDVKKSDLIIEFAARNRKSNINIKNKKILLISHENLYFKRNLLSIIESLLHIIGLENKKHKIIDSIDSILPKFILKIPIKAFLPKYLKFIKDIKSNIRKDSYAIISNDIKHGNLFIMPIFLQQYHDNIKNLSKKNTNIYSEKKKFCAFIVSSNSSRERVDFFKKLSEYKKIDSYGKVMNNMGDVLFKSDWKSLPKILSQYKFVICFENSFANEYITEKMPNVMFANSIPIYRGAPNICKYFNTDSFIGYENYKSYDKMIEKIIELDKDDDKYSEFLSRPLFKNNKILEIIKNKEKKMIEFYRKILT